MRFPIKAKLAAGLIARAQFSHELIAELNALVRTEKKATGTNGFALNLTAGGPDHRDDEFERA